MTRSITPVEDIKPYVEVNKADYLSSIQSYSIIVVIDSRVPAYETLAAGVISGVQVHILNSNQDGVEQISELLNAIVLTPQTSSLALHLVCLGAPACLSLGNTQLNLKTMERYAWELQSWFTALPSQLLLYGSQVGTGPTGSEFVQILHTLTGATIHASTMKVGNPSLGGRWELDITLGQHKPTIAFTAETQTTYPAVL